MVERVSTTANNALPKVNAGQWNVVQQKTNIDNSFKDRIKMKMTRSDKINQNVICNIDKLQVNWQEIDNSYIGVYINHLVKRFRNNNNDDFFITISGLNRFIDKDDKVLNFLLELLSENSFNISFTGDEDSINQINIDCTNITKKKSYDFQYQIQDLVSIVELSSKTDIPIVGIFIMKIIAQIITRSKILYKAIVLDLDDTLWPGTLSEIGINNISKNLSSDQGVPFIAFMKFCRTLANELGIYIAICSRNNSDQVKKALNNQLQETVFPLKNQIDCIVANNNDKSDNIKIIAQELSILPDYIVFIDDNQIARDDVKNKFPNLFVPEWANHEELLTQLKIGCIFDRIELSLTSKNRKKQYKIIQSERTQNTLPELFIKVSNDNNHIESSKLYSKSNQFKVSSNDANFDINAKSLYFEISRDNGENLGICSTITYNISDETITLINWAISCRYFQIGIEEFILLYLQKIAIRNKVLINYQKSDYNLKAIEMLQKYCNVFKNDSKDNIAVIEFTEETLNNLMKNTNLKEVYSV
jgi:FkbH-like protein